MRRLQGMTEAKGIMIYTGNINDAPKDWILCDGQNGTIDLSDRFIKCADDEEIVGELESASSHNHELSLGGSAHVHIGAATGSHAHVYSSSSTGNRRRGGAEAGSHTHSSTSSGSAHTHTVYTTMPLPLYYKVLFFEAPTRFLEELPFESIALFRGEISQIPRGWAICNGQNSTPDLRDRFIKCAIDNEDIGSIGGRNHSHTLTNNGAHTHTSAATEWSHTVADHQKDNNVNTPGEGTRSGSSFGGSSHTHILAEAGGHTHDLTDGEIRVAHCKLIYIKKISKY